MKGSLVLVLLPLHPVTNFNVTLTVRAADSQFTSLKPLLFHNPCKLGKGTPAALSFLQTNELEVEFLRHSETRHIKTAKKWQATTQHERELEANLRQPAAELERKTV